MRLSALVLLALTCAAPAQSPPPASSASRQPPAASRSEFDILIRHGDVIDGTGSARKRADVAIKDGLVAAIGDLSQATAKTTIDATNQVVAPGFIDLLGHSEGAVLIDPNLESKVRQGVTTEVTGEGHSPGPINDAMAAEVNRTKPPGFPDATWRSLADYMRAIEKRGSAINFAFYIGAANSREMVIGDADRPPTAEELKKMEAITEQAMRDGAIGLSTALIYPPGRFATTDELIALARVAGRYGGGYWTHLRNEANTIDTALDEAFRIGREAHVPVNIFHLKSGGAMRGHMQEVVDRIERARKSGLDAASQIYPYTATSTDLQSTIPAWALRGGYLQFVARLKDPAARTRIANEIRVGDGSTILIRGIPEPTTMKQYERKRLDAIAREMKTTSAEAALRLFEGSNASPIAIFFNLLESDLMTAMKQPWVAVGSDSGAVVGAARQQGAHPRAYGTFPRILGHYVRDEHLFPLEEAVRKMTSFAASRAGLKDRGMIAKGMRADVVVFDPKTICDTSTYEDPHHFAEGISNVIVNGVPVLRDGKMTGALPGKILRRGGAGS
jgi:N-acyl-D-aspartate/D-glutamate deacylase